MTVNLLVTFALQISGVITGDMCRLLKNQREIAFLQVLLYNGEDIVVF